MARNRNETETGGQILPMRNRAPETGSMPPEFPAQGAGMTGELPGRMPERAGLPGAGMPGMGGGAVLPEIPQGGQFIRVVDSDQIRKWNLALTRYKSGKHSEEVRVKDAERWWKMRNQYMIDRDTDSGDQDWGFRSKSAWLHNVVSSKHADYIEAFPAPNVRAREEGDKPEAEMLSKIIPVILRYNDFEGTYDSVGWQKIKTGTGIYKITWDRTKQNGLGDISIMRRNMLQVFWEPGIEDIQASKYFFDVEEYDRETLEEKWPELKDENLGSALTLEKMPTDDNVDTENKVPVIDVYYKRRGKLHYCKYAGEHVIYSSEDDHEVYRTDRNPMTGDVIAVHSRASDGFYEHGLYPYVFDTLYPVEGSPAGYGHIDINANSQEQLDMLRQTMTENAMVSSVQRYFVKGDSDFNEQEYLNIKKKLIHVSGSLDETKLLAIPVTALNGNLISYYNNLVQELRETSGNTETAAGITSSGVTAASAIAELQQASGKGSRDSTQASYRAFQKICFFVIELIRQFYDLPRQFRITGEMGVESYVTFSNEKMRPQWQGMIGGEDMGYRVPQYDIDVVPEKEAGYTKLSQNQMALDFYGNGFFVPDNADQSLACLEMMDFDTKDQVMQKIAENGTLQQKLLQWQRLALELANRFTPEMVPGLAQQITGQRPMMPSGDPGAETQIGATEDDKEATIIKNARARADAASQPGGMT